MFNTYVVAQSDSNMRVSRSCNRTMNHSRKFTTEQNQDVAMSNKLKKHPKPFQSSKLLDISVLKLPLHTPAHTKFTEEPESIVFSREPWTCLHYTKYYKVPSRRYDIVHTLQMDPFTTGSKLWLYNILQLKDIRDLYWVNFVYCN